MNNKKQNLELRTQNLEGAKIQGSRRGTEVFRAKWSQFSERSSLSSGMTMNSLGRGNWVLMFGLLVVGMMVFVGAVAWNATANDITYNATEDLIYYHNFTVNLSDSSDLEYFRILNITWDGGSESNHVDFPWLQWNDTGFSDSATGVLKVNASHNNKTGNFTLNVLAQGTGGGHSNYFNFTITPVNDAPNFTELINGELYNFTEDSTSNLIIQYNATDEEGEYDGTGYPLNFSSNVTWCNSSINVSDCNDLFSLSRVGNKSMELNISRTDDYVGYYNVTFWVNDSVSQTEVNVSFEIINTNDAPNITFACDNDRDKVEDEIMSCWINATDVDEEGNLTFAISSNLGQFTFNDSSTGYVYDCSGSGDCNASANVTFVLNDSAVGNWSVNISVTDTGTENTIDWANFSFFVNNTEDNVTMDNKASFTEYEGSPHQFNITAYDDDLRVDDSQTSVKNEALTFATNDSNIIYNLDTQTVSGNKSVIIAYINWSYADINNITNASIKINVTDRLGVAGPEIYSFDETIFTITFDYNNSAPVWNDSGAVYDFLIEENSSWSGVNLSDGYVNDSDEDSISFYYTNDTQFDNFDLSNSTGSWIINFTAEDVDVGYHNITMIASDGNVNVTHEFNFTVSNIADSPSIVNTNANSVTFYNESEVNATENSEIVFELVVDDDDFLIPNAQITNYSFYNESLTVDVTATRSNGTEENLFEFSFVEFGNPSDESVSYNASFTPTNAQVDNYTVVINITDNSSISISRTFYLNISDVPNNPNLTTIENHSVTIHDYLNFTVNGTDVEDGTNLSYSIANLSVGSPNLTIGNESGIVAFNMSSNSSYAGTWDYNVTVSDLDGGTDSQVFYLYVYGNSTLVLPDLNSVFNLTENNASILNFTINHSVADNLTYEFWIDSISCLYQNNSNCSYGNLINRETNSSFGNGSVYGWSFTPNYTDETYGNYKNLTVRVYPNTTNLNSTQLASVATNFTFRLNISHVNSPVSFICTSIPDDDATWTQTIDYNLTSCFYDADAFDSYYLQDINFSVRSQTDPSYVKANSFPIPANISYNSWQLNFSTVDTTNETVEIIILSASDINDTTNETITTANSNNFSVTFTEPVVETVVVTTPSSGGGTTTKLKHFSIKLIVPQDVIISEMNYIDIPFTVQNNGEIDLKGINLNSFVRFNDEFSDDVKISLGDNYIELLKFGQSENFTMRILANTQRAGKYKATIWANVTSPKLSDWGEFFIELRKTNESEAEQILIFTEKFISENPECLELTELIRRAEAEFLTGDYSKAVSSAREATEACENAIIANEQIKYPITGFVRDNFYYISFSTLVIFLLGFAFYVYKRVRFNKYKVDEYI